MCDGKDCGCEQRLAESRARWRRGDEGRKERCIRIASVRVFQVHGLRQATHAISRLVAVPRATACLPRFDLCSRHPIQTVEIADDRHDLIYLIQRRLLNPPPGFVNQFVGTLSVEDAESRPSRLNRGLHLIKLTLTG